MPTGAWRTSGISSPPSEPPLEPSAWRAPGRVNIVGEHIDYLGGTVLPFACDLELACTVVPAPGVVELASPEGRARFGLDDPSPPAGWGARVWGVARVLAEEGLPVRGIRGEVRSEIPVGAGLSSSAALGAAVGLALTGGVRPEPAMLQRAEQVGTGVPCGVMDQTAVLVGRAGHAMLIDCGTGEVSHVPIPEEVGFVVLDTGTRRELADGRYAERRAEAEAGMPARIRHAETEQRRVHEAVAALGSRDLDALGTILDASHASLRDDYEVSSDALDLAAATLREHPVCTGARMIGGGFGGCVLGVVEAAGAEEAAIWTSDRLRDRLPGSKAFVVDAVQGAGPVA